MKRLAIETLTRSRKEIALMVNIQKMRSQRMGMEHTIIHAGSAGWWELRNHRSSRASAERLAAFARQPGAGGAGGDSDGCAGAHTWPAAYAPGSVICGFMVKCLSLSSAFRLPSCSGPAHPHASPR